MAVLLLEILAQGRRRGGWFSELTGISLEIPGEWYWLLVGVAVGITVVGWIIGRAKKGKR